MSKLMYKTVTIKGQINDLLMCYDTGELKA